VFIDLDGCRIRERACVFAHVDHGQAPQAAEARPLVEISLVSRWLLLDFMMHPTHGSLLSVFESAFVHGLELPTRNVGFECIERVLKSAHVHLIHGDFFLAKQHVQDAFGVGWLCREIVVVGLAGCREIVVVGLAGCRVILLSAFGDLGERIGDLARRGYVGNN
jgi:hypothetical protein